MGVIIRVDSKKLLKEFLPEVNQADYQFMLISENITTNGEFENVIAMKRLIPPPHVAASFVNDGFKTYKKAYLHYLQKDDIEALLSIIVKGVMVNDLKIVMVCSKTEDELKYLKLICEYIEEVYGLKTYTAEEYLKNPEKALKVKNRDDIMRILHRKFQKMQESNVEINKDYSKDKLLKGLKKLGKKELRKFAESRNIKLKDGLDKEKMIKKIMKKLTA